jgi:hypothetical protein
MGVTAGIFLASILLKEMRYLVYIRYLWFGPRARQIKRTSCRDLTATMHRGFVKIFKDDLVYFKRKVKRTVQSPRFQ